jgi:hypothetical protein
MRIERASITVSLPGASGRVDCSAGRPAAPRACAIGGAGTAEITISATDLPPRSGIVVRATMADAAPGRPTLPWSVAWDPILGRSVPVLVLVIAGAVGALVAGISWAHASREDPPGFPVQYAPPDGLGPVQVVFMDTESTGSHALVATLMHMADRGLVQLERSGERWTITGLVPAGRWEAEDPASQAVSHVLSLRSGGSFVADPDSASGGKVVAAARDAIAPAVREWATAAGLVRTAPDEIWGRVAWGFAVALAVLGFTGIAWPTVLGLPFAAFVVGGSGLLAAGVGRRRTTSGRQVWSRAGGFQRLLSTPSAGDRFDFAARRDLFVAYIPYAVAYGVADRWAEKYRVATGTEPPIPTWYP